MPEDGKNIIKFKNFYKQQKSPFVIYADFESLTKKIEGAEMDPNKSNTINTQLHEACSYCYIVVRSDGKTNKPVGPNAAEHMLKSLMKEQDKILKTLANPKPMKMTKKDITNFENAKDCHICEKPLIIPEYRSTTDYHDPNTGKQIGQIHKKCPSFNRANIFDDGLAAIHMHKSKLVLNRPIFVGMSVLDLSKTLLYDFYYNKLLKQYGKNVDLLYTDTDSLLLEIKTENVYKDIERNIEEYYTSDFPEDNFLHNTKNKKYWEK